MADRQGDCESIRSTTAAGSSGYSFVIRTEVPGGPVGTAREILAVRAVPMADHLHARTMRLYFDQGDAPVFAGTMPGVSGAIDNELRSSWRAAMTYIDQRPVFGLPSARPLKGTVVRVGEGAEDFPVIVNGRRRRSSPMPNEPWVSCVIARTQDRSRASSARSRPTPHCKKRCAHRSMQ